MIPLNSKTILENLKMHKVCQLKPPLLIFHNWTIFKVFAGVKKHSVNFFTIVNDKLNTNVLEKTNILFIN